MGVCGCGCVWVWVCVWVDISVCVMAGCYVDRVSDWLPACIGLDWLLVGCVLDWLFVWILYWIGLVACVGCVLDLGFIFRGWLTDSRVVAFGGIEGDDG